MWRNPLQPRWQRQKGVAPAASRSTDIARSTAKKYSLSCSLFLAKCRAAKSWEQILQRFVVLIRLRLSKFCDRKLGIPLRSRPEAYLASNIGRIIGPISAIERLSMRFGGMSTALIAFSRDRKSRNRCRDGCICELGTNGETLERGRAGAGPCSFPPGYGVRA